MTTKHRAAVVAIATAMTMFVGAAGAASAQTGSVGQTACPSGARQVLMGSQLRCVREYAPGCRAGARYRVDLIGRRDVCQFVPANLAPRCLGGGELVIRRGRDSCRLFSTPRVIVR